MKWIGYKCAICKKEYKPRKKNTDPTQSENIVFSTGFCKKCFIEKVLPSMIENKIISQKDIPDIIGKTFKIKHYKKSCEKQTSKEKFFTLDFEKLNSFFVISIQKI